MSDLNQNLESAADPGATPTGEALWTNSVGRGSVIAGKYRIDGFLGEGGMGVVLAATHLELDVKVAIKLKLPGLFQNAETAARFEREARATVRIQSDHVARIHDLGRLPDGSPFIVMELLEGSSLLSVTESPWPVSTMRAVDIVIQACVGLAEAHRLGVIHRDLKPENLFLAFTPERGETLKILDFGIAKASWDGLPTRTEGGMGTPAYAAPEQLRCASEAGPPADIWSLGVVLFELLTGQLPFQAASLGEMCVAVLTKRPPLLRSIRPDCPAELEGVVSRCLEVDPTLRYQSVVAFARDLAPFASTDGAALALRLRHRLTEREPSHLDLPLVRPRLRSLALETNAGPTLTPGATSTPAKRQSRRPGPILLVAALVAMVLFGSVASMRRSSSTASDAPNDPVLSASEAPHTPAPEATFVPSAPTPTTAALAPPTSASALASASAVAPSLEPPPRSSATAVESKPTSPRPSRARLFDGFGGRR